MKRFATISRLLLLGLVLVAPLSGSARHREGGSDPASLTISPLESGPLSCAEAQLLTFGYEPAVDSPPARGYEIRLLASAELAIDSSGVTFIAIPEDADILSYAIDGAPGELVLSYAILGDSGQIDTAADLFTLEVGGAGTGDGTVQITSVIFRDLENDAIAVAAGEPALVSYDCTPPAAITGLSADPGHNQITLNWDHDGNDVDHFAIFRGLWYDTDIGSSAYPEYGALETSMIPTRPESLAGAFANPEWELVSDEVPSHERTFLDVWPDGANRGVYYYEVFAVDQVQNTSAPAVQNARATNYRLGDFDGDGVVDSADVRTLDTAFGTVHDAGASAIGFNPFCDIGPTADGSRVGVPEPDRTIDLEDLIILAMNFDVAPGVRPLPADGATMDLVWAQIAAGRYELHLFAGQGLKALRVRATLPPGTVINVNSGSLLDAQDQPVFVRNVGDGLDVSLAVLGTGQGVVGTGALLVAETAVDIAGQDLVFDARDLDNGSLPVDLVDLPTGVMTSPEFSLGANYPNPFNPVTTIRFAIPRPQHVRLMVYSTDGKRVATLADGQFAAGVHDLTWDGTTGAGQPATSGVYHYRIDAGAHRQTGKMVLIK